MTLLNKLYQKRKIYIYLPLSLYWLALFIGTSIPGGSIPTIGVSDKFKHFGGYLFLAVFLNFAFLFQERYPIIRKHYLYATMLVASTYGIVDELHQSFIPGRSCDFYDWIADVVGVILAVLLFKILVKPKKMVNKDNLEQ